MKTILITGATGFLGRQILKSLSSFDVSLVPVVRPGKQIELSHCRNVDRVVTTADVFSESQDWWTNQCSKVDTVIHCAWYTEPGKYLDAAENLNCLSGSLKLAAGAATAGVKRFVGIGTCFEYDLSHRVLSVETPVLPSTLYAASKASLYFLLSTMMSVHSIEFAWLRVFYLFGEGENECRFVPYLRRQLSSGLEAELTAGNQIRDFLDVSLAGRIVANLALESKVGVFNVCSGQPTTVRQLVERIADEYGRRDLLRFDRRKDHLFDPACVLGIPNY